MKKLLLSFLVIVICLSGVYLLFPSIIFDLSVKAERGVAGLEQYQIEVDGLRFEYLEGGEGETLVLLHGFGANKDNWTRIAAYLTPHFRIIAPDLTGFGGSSEAVDGDYTISRQTERLALFLSELGVDSFHLGGNSMGGYLAGMYAHKYAEQVSSLLLFAPAEVKAAQPGELEQLLAAGKPNPLVVRNVDDYERLLNFVFTGRPFIPGSIKEVLVAESIAYQDLHDAIYEQLLQDDSTPALESLLSEFTAPVAILWGENDRVLHVSGADVLAGAIPNSQVYILKKTGHLPMLEKPEQSATYYLEFLKSRAAH